MPAGRHDDHLAHHKLCLLDNLDDHQVRQEVDHCVARQEVDHHELQLRIVVACLEAESRNEKYLQADVSLTHHHHGYQLANGLHADLEALLGNLHAVS
jgi:hypothetical protein